MTQRPQTEQRGAEGRGVAGLAAELAPLCLQHDDTPIDVLRRLGEVIGSSAADGPFGGPVTVEDVRDLVVANLLADGHLTVAWEVVQDYAAGLIQRPFHGATSAGSRRSAVPAPAFTFTEGTRAFAWLTGFRDPRYLVPDDCYDISALVEPEVRLDEIAVHEGRLAVSGSARWRHLSPSPADEVLVALSPGTDPTGWVRAARTHRAQLTTGSRTGLSAGLCAGWHAELPLRAADLRQRTPLQVGMARGKFIRVLPAVPASGDVARAAAASTVRTGRRRFRVGIGDGQVSVMAVPTLPVRAARRAARLVRWPKA